ncbi:hypothetical protein [Pseudomonas bohemica]|uniref:hypothetical protein n=1 Tax=Pseudomonas bohemica TaxID=2044872 RepID=UPI000DA6008E|nr:hypothetical protein [Pseudomonas bohemica]
MMVGRRGYFALFLLATGLVNLVLCYLAQDSFIAWVFNADALYLPSIFQNILASNGAFSDWYLTPAPYLFPDYPMFLLSYWLGSGAGIRLTIFSLIQTLLTFGAIWMISAHVARQRAVLIAAAATTLLLYLAIHSGQPFVFMLVSAFHYGAFLVSMVFVGIWLLHQKLELPPMVLAGVGALVFITSLSDSIFIVQTIAPFITTTFLFLIVDKSFTWKKLVPLTALVVVSLLGLSFTSFITDHRAPFKMVIGITELSSNFDSVVGFWRTIVCDNPIYGILQVAYVGIVVHSCCSALRKYSVDGLPRPLIWIVIFSALATCATLAVVVLLTNMPFTSRYFIPAFTWPIIAVLLYLDYWFGRRLGSVIILISLIAMVLLSFGTYRLIKANGLPYPYYPSTLSCIDGVLEKNRVFNGIAQYWDAKYIQYFSRLSLNLAQYSRTLEPFRWITSEKYFRSRYDFAIVSDHTDPSIKLSVDMIKRLNGEPTIVATCDDKTIYIYGKDKMQVQKLSETGSSYRWQGCELLTIIGRKTDQCEMEKNEVHASGYLTYGPYEPLFAGRYAAEITYSSKAKTTETVGGWDVVFALPDMVVLNNGPLVGTDGVVVKIKTEFVVGEKYNMEKIQVRTLALTEMDLKVIDIKIYRLL